MIKHFPVKLEIPQLCMLIALISIKNIVFHFLIILKGQYDRLFPYMAALNLLYTHRWLLPSNDKILFLHPLNMRFLCNFLITMEFCESETTQFLGEGDFCFHPLGNQTSCREFQGILLSELVPVPTPWREKLPHGSLQPFSLLPLRMKAHQRVKPLILFSLS